MTYAQFFNTYNGKKIDWDGSFGGQCVDLFRQYHHEVIGGAQPKGVVGAADFWDNFEIDQNLWQHYIKIPNSETFIPKVGDVVIWSRGLGNGYGHIGVANGNGSVFSFESFDQNWKTISVCEIIKHDYKHVYGVFRPKKEVVMDELLKYLGVATNAEAKTKLKEHLGEHEGKCDWGNETHEGGHLGSARRTIKNQAKTISDLHQEIDSHVCPITPPSQPNEEWVLNGKTETQVINGVTITKNYAVKR